ncbi:MAG: terminase family protein [Nanoarchaeota archaeon]|nr:terminase family protein [Nanoarchaeota archaeon]
MLTKNKKILFGLIESMGFKPHKGQRAVLKAFLKFRFLCVVCGRRWGKTKIASMLVLYTLLEKDTKSICISKTYKLSKKLWNYVYKDVLRFYGAGVVNINKSEMIMTTPWGSTLELGSADNPDGLLGDTYDLQIIDEAATLKGMMWEQFISPSARDRKGTVVLITTPRGHNWIHKLFNLGQKLLDGWWSRTGHSFENTAIYDPEEQDLVKSQTDPLYFSQEYAASFVVFADQVYSDFREEDHVVTLDDMPNLKDWDIYASIDPGYAVMCAIQWIAYNKASGEILIYDEVLEKRLKYPAIIQNLRRREPKGGYAGFICEVAGNQRDQAGYSFIQTLEEDEWFLKKDYTIYAKRYGIIKGLNKVRAKLLNTKDEIHLKVTQNCTGTIGMFLNYHYPEKKATEKPEKDGVWDHPADTTRYFVEFIDYYENGTVEYDL